jgi:SAM-dependent methyltransferase
MKGLDPPTDAELEQINKMLDWHAGTLLPDGRLLGRLERRPGKRTEPGIIPDPRLTRLNKLINLKQKRVLEIGCFEGIHTLGLLHYCDDVTAVDVRPQNVVKTLARLSWHGQSAKVFQKDVERIDASAFPRFDVVVHIGVLYHLARPVEHLTSLAPACAALFLDTHVARDEKNLADLHVAGQTYRGAEHVEGGWADPFSGRGDKAFWLTQESLLRALANAGFRTTQVLQEREERNGPRVLLLATKSEPASTAANGT